MKSAPVRSIGFPNPFPKVFWIWDTDSPLKRHSQYRAAKAGSQAAAVEVVGDLALSSLSGLTGKIPPGRCFVAPHAREATGDNAIPQVMAAAASLLLRGTLEHEIVQTTRVYHTGADAMERLAYRPMFSGPIFRNRRYVLVDDVTNLGGTLAELSDFLGIHGGIVEGCILLVNAGRSKELIPCPKRVKLLTVRYGKDLQDQIQVAPQALTANEADYLIGFRSLDEIRNRILKARKETNLRLRSKGIAS